ncbi:MAG: carboxypeptidase-like regulatory domain-containing protein, partial [Crocinitomicaceae bacterium]
MIRLLLSIALLVPTFNLFAQKPASDGMVIGRIVSSISKKPLEYIKVRLLKAADSSVIFTQYSDSEGRFRFENLPYTSAILSVSSNSYDSVFLRDVLPTKEIRIVNIGSIELKPQKERTTDEITIQRKQEILYSGIDKKVYNVGQDLTVRGGTANDVLKNLP